jgi:Uncharacterized protein conserved in bacteria (DUF2188)
MPVEKEDQMARPNAREVRPDGKGGWNVIKPGGERASANFGTQAAAAARAEQILRNDGGGELRVAGRDGQIREANTIPPGNDPRRSPG